MATKSIERVPGDFRSGPAYLSSLERSKRAAHDRALLRRYHEFGDQTARDELVQRFMPLARQYARRYRRNGGEPVDDLVQVAALGLVKAIDGFDPDRPTAFSSYAVPTILGELKRHFRDKTWSIRVPRDLQELAVKVGRATEEIGRELGRAPTPSEIAKRLDVSIEDVLEAREAAAAYRTVSLDRASTDDADGSVSRSFGSDDPGYQRAEAAAMVSTMMRKLSPRERQVLKLRFGADLTQSEIGAQIGISQMHVSRLLRQAIERLRHESHD